MPFDNEAFTAWLIEFEHALIATGMSEVGAIRYRAAEYPRAVAHFAAGTPAEDAAIEERLRSATSPAR